MTDTSSSRQGESEDGSPGAESRGHVAVLLAEAVEALVAPHGETEGTRFVDATYGRGGHSQLLLSRMSSESELLAIDRDPEAVADARRRMSGEPRFTIVKSNFAALDEVLESRGWSGKVDGLLVDLGVSSPQLDQARRGFGFSRNGALDMRMDPESGVSAADWIARVDQDELANVLRDYGEERYARRIAGAIVSARAESPILRTGQLAEIIKAAHPRWERHHHPATRSFQAIRIAVNAELDALKAILLQARKALRPGGRLAVISFHSLEDRLVKRAFRIPPPDPTVPRHLPLPETAAHPWRSVGKAIRASRDELDRNPRARSAVLRIAERIA